MLVKIGTKYVRPDNIQEITLVDDKSFKVEYTDINGQTATESITSTGSAEHDIKIIINECNQIIGIR